MMDIIIGKKQFIALQTCKGKYEFLLEIVNIKLNADKSSTFELNLFQESNLFSIGAIVNVDYNEEAETAILDKLKKECDEGLHFFFSC